MPPPPRNDIVNTASLIDVKPNRSPDEKNNSSNMDQDSIKEDISSIIDEQLSIPNLIREMCSCKVLKSILFTKYHMKLLPVVEIEMERRRKKLLEEEKVKKNKKVDRSSEISILNNIGSFTKDMMDYNTALDMIYNKNTSIPIHNDINQFFINHLPTFLRRDVQPHDDMLAHEQVQRDDRVKDDNFDKSFELRNDGGFGNELKQNDNLSENIIDNSTANRMMKRYIQQKPVEASKRPVRNSNNLYY